MKSIPLFAAPNVRLRSATGSTLDAVVKFVQQAVAQLPAAAKASGRVLSSSPGVARKSVLPLLVEQLPMNRLRQLDAPSHQQIVDSRRVRYDDTHAASTTIPIVCLQGGATAQVERGVPARVVAMQEACTNSVLRDVLLFGGGRKLALVHIQQFPDVPVRIVETTTIHPAVILSILAGRTAGCECLVRNLIHLLPALERQSR